MAITASVALSSSSVNQGQKVVATLTVSNSGSSTVTVTDIKPKITPSTAAAALGIAPFGGAQTSTVAGSGSTDFYFPLVGLAPQVSNPNQSPATFTLTIGATVYTNDGSITEASTASLTVNPSITVI